MLKRIVFAFVVVSFVLLFTSSPAQAQISLYEPKDLANMLDTLRHEALSDDICTLFVRHVAAHDLNDAVLERTDELVDNGNGAGKVMLLVKYLQTSATETEILRLEADRRLAMAYTQALRAKPENYDFLAFVEPIHCQYIRGPLRPMGNGQGYSTGLYFADKLHMAMSLSVLVKREENSDIYIDPKIQRIEESNEIMFGDEISVVVRDQAKALSPKLVEAYLSGDADAFKDLYSLLVEYRVTPQAMGLPADIVAKILNGLISQK